MQRLFPNKTTSRVIRLFVGLATLLSAISVVTLTQPANAVLSSLPTFVNADLTAGVEAAPYVFDYKATDSQTSTHLLTTFEGTADYTVNGGAPIALTSGSESPVINLGSGDSISDRVTKIVLTHRNNGNTVYTLRIFRMKPIVSFQFRDKANTSATYSNTETQSDPFTFNESLDVPHTLTQLEFKAVGTGYYQFWSGMREIATADWEDLNWSACCLFRDGANTWLPGTVGYYPFRGEAILGGIGDGPSFTYNFTVNRATAFGTSILTSFEIPEISAMCSSSPIECVEVSPGYFDIRAVDDTRNITIKPTFSTGTASYSVDGGNNIAINSSTSASITLSAGDSVVARSTKIDVIHQGAFNTTYHFRIFRMKPASGFQFRDKTNPADLYTASESTTGDFSRSESINIPHTLTQLEFKMLGTGHYEFWSGMREISNANWEDLNWSACCLFRDGLNTWLPGTIGYYPFRGDSILDGKGNGPSMTYSFNIDRATAFGSSILTSLEIPSISAMCSAAPTECTESSPGYFDIRAVDTTRSITLSPTFTTGTATYSVNGGTTRSLTSGVQSSTISLATGDSTSARVTKIEVVHRGAFDTTYHFRIFRMKAISSFQLRDKENTGNLYNASETIDSDFARSESVNVPHSLNQLEFKVTGSGYYQFWSGMREISTANWEDLNWSACCLFRDGANTWLPGTIGYYPFRGDSILDGIGDGPSMTYSFTVNRAYAYGQGPTTTTTTSTTTTTVPTGTTTTEPSTTTTTVVSGGGSGSGGGNGSGGSSDSTVTTVAQGQNDIVTIAPSSSTTVASVSQAAVSTTSSSTSTSTTTLPPDVVARGAVSTPAPTVAEIALGAAAMTIDGKEVKVNITRVNNQIVVSGAGVTMTMSVVSVNNERVPLDSIGGLRFGSGDKVVMQAVGLAPDEEITLWAFSTPTSLGTVKADANGKIAGTFKMPSTLEKGDHRLVLQGLNSDGKKIVLGVGVGVGQVEKSSSLSRILIAVPIALAVFFGVVLPTQARRRRRRIAAA